MKPALLLAAAMFALGESTQAQSIRCDQFGDMQTCSGPGGYRSTQDTFGDTTTGRDSLGNTWRTTTFGNTTTTQVTPGSRQRGW
jgi:hypothetical protein